ncbi:MAG: tyrosine-type recombinase/integrase [Bacteroidia bacterium]
MAQTNIRGKQLKLRFYLEAKRTNKKTGQQPIYLEMRAAGQRSYISIRRQVLCSQWDENNELVQRTCRQADIINKHLIELRSIAEEKWQKLEATISTPNVYMLKDAILNADKGHYTLKQLMDRFYAQKYKQIGVTIKVQSIKPLLSLKTKVENYLSKNYKHNDISLLDLKPEFIEDFHIYLRQLGLNVNTTMKLLRTFKEMTGYAVKLHWLDSNPFDDFRISFCYDDLKYLTESELHSLEVKQITVERVRLVRDIFLFCCYTGLSYADVRALRHTDIEQDSSMSKIVKNRQKTDERSVIPLLNKALAIIQQYKDHPATQSSGNVFPVFSNQKMNAYLKEVADICGVTKKLTFHMSRHTAATTVFLSNDVPLETVQKILGHAKITTTQRYAKIVDTKVVNDIQRLEQKLKQLP